MTGHDRIVLSVARNLLDKGAKQVEIGARVVARRKIVTRLRGEFPQRKVFTKGG